MTGWPALPRSLRLGICMYGAMSLFTLMVSFASERVQAWDAIQIVERSAGFASLMLVLIGAIDLRRRATRRRVELTIVMASAIGEIVFHGVWIAVDVYISQHNGGGDDGWWSWLPWVQRANLAVVAIGAIGWGVGARNPVLGIVLVVLAILQFMVWDILRWLDITWSFENIERVREVVDALYMVVLAATAGMAAFEAQVRPIDRAPGAGFGAMASAIWLRLASVGMLVFAMVVLSHGDDATRLAWGAFLAQGVAVAAAILLGLGAAGSCHEPTAIGGGGAGWWAQVAAAFAFASAQCAIGQLEDAFGALRHVSQALEHEPTTTIAAGVFALAAIAIALGAGASFAKNRDVALGSDLSMAAMLSTVLSVISIGVVVLASHAESFSALAVTVLAAGAFALGGLIVAGRGFAKAARTLTTGPVIPPARIVQR